MKGWSCALALAVLAPVSAREPPKPGPEHELLKKREGTRDVAMKAGGTEFKGAVTYKMELGGLWPCGSMGTDPGGMKFSGKSLDTYDAGKKFVGVWADGMGTTPMLMGGTLAPATKALTTTGEGPGPDGKVTGWKSVSSMPDSDTVEMSTFVGAAGEPMFTVASRRKK